MIQAQGGGENYHRKKIFRDDSFPSVSAPEQIER
jgi:hypothetical protein